METHTWRSASADGEDLCFTLCPSSHQHFSLTALLQLVAACRVGKYEQDSASFGIRSSACGESQCILDEYAERFWPNE